MRRILVVTVLVLTLLMALAGVSSAQEQRSERACAGAFISTVAQEAGGVGQFASVLAKELQPFGGTISEFATTCVNPFEG